MARLIPCYTMPKPKGTYGLYARNHPKSVRDRLDIDYAHKLTQEEREWLAQALDETVSGDFSHARPFVRDAQMRREIYREKNAANRDIWGLGLRDDGDRGVDEEPGQGMAAVEATPEYLNSEEYKRALAEYRAHLPSNERYKPKETPEMLLALQKLERTKW